MSLHHSVFKNNWFQAQKARGVLLALDATAMAGPGEYVEVGSWEGKSSVFLANEIKPRTLHCFDHWLGHDSDLTADLAAERDVAAEFRENMDALTSGNYEAHRGDWRDTLIPFLADHPVRFLYLDAAHTYDEVSAQLAVIVPALVPGGVLAGDDYGRPGVKRAVTEKFGEVRVVPKGNGVWYIRP